MLRMLAACAASLLVVLVPSAIAALAQSGAWTMTGAFSKANPAPGDTETITLTIVPGSSATANVVESVVDPNGQVANSQIQNGVQFVAGQTKTVTFTWVVQGPAGSYTLSADVSGYVTKGGLASMTVGGAPNPTPTVAPTSTPAPSGQPALLASYEFNQPTYANMDKVAYHPYGQFKNGYTWNDARWGSQSYYPDGTKFAGWDILNLDNEGIERTQTDPNFLHLKLNRQATVGVLWKSTTAPSWLSGWTDTGPSFYKWFACPSDGCHIFTKVVGAGNLDLGGPSIDGAEHDVYDVLLADPTGKPPALPVQKGTPAAAPNQTCPAWVASSYTATGKDGVARQAWSPQIDPTYWCYMRSEHGSDPRLFWNGTDPVTGKPFTTIYGAASAAMGMKEAPAGFKNYAFEAPDGKGFWLFVHHFGTSSLQATCESNERGTSAGRFHEVQIFYRPTGASQPTVRLTFNGDFGVATDNANPAARLTPSVCPNQGTDVLGDPSHGSRQIPSDNTPNVAFYEPWVVNLAMAHGLGLSGLINFNTLDQGRHCNVTPACDSIDMTSLPGAHRYMEPNSGFHISPPPGGQTGWFCTDHMGMAVVSCGTPGSLYQYIAPGFTGANWQYVDDNHFVDLGAHPWVMHGGDAYSQACREADLFVDCYSQQDIHVDGGPAQQALENSIVISSTNPN